VTPIQDQQGVEQNILGLYEKECYLVVPSTEGYQVLTFNVKKKQYTVFKNEIWWLFSLFSVA
jgi:hypothetical protein